MYYDDQARRFNFISGLLLGGLLGTGLALVAAKTGLPRRRRASPVARAREQAVERWEEVRSGVSGAVSDGIAAGRKRLER